MNTTTIFKVLHGLPETSDKDIKEARQQHTNLHSRKCLADPTWTFLANAEIFLFGRSRLLPPSKVYELHSYALSREVSRFELFAKIPSLPVEIGKTHFQSLLKIHYCR